MESGSCKLTPPDKSRAKSCPATAPASSAKLRRHTLESHWPAKLSALLYSVLSGVAVRQVERRWTLPRSSGPSQSWERGWSHFWTPCLPCACSSLIRWTRKLCRRASLLIPGASSSGEAQWRSWAGLTQTLRGKRRRWRSLSRSCTLWSWRSSENFWCPFWIWFVKPIQGATCKWFAPAAQTPTPSPLRVSCFLRRLRAPLGPQSRVCSQLCHLAVVLVGMRATCSWL